MPRSDPLEDYRSAVHDLRSLEPAVQRQESRDQVVDALSRLRLAVTRLYGSDQRPRAAAGKGARQLILDYLLDNAGEWVEGDELAAVSGIGEWARRVRELRVESGYQIDEDHGRYRLASAEADASRRDRWLAVTFAREVEGQPIDRVRFLLEHLVGIAVASAELDRVARAKSGAALARSLRMDEQWPVECPGDAPDLGPEQFRLASRHEAHRLHPAQRLFPEELRGRLFRRDRFRCWNCGSVHGEVEPSGSNPFYLVVRHLEVPQTELAQLPARRLLDLSALATHCNRCPLP